MAIKAISRPSIDRQNTQNGFVRSAATTLLAWHDKLHRRDVRKPDISTSIRVACVSDTHNSQPELPDGDILLHAGDLSQYGTFDEIQKQLDWLNAQSHKWKVAIAGNHDLLLDRDFVDAHPDRELEKMPGKRRGDLRWGDVIYLQNSAVELEMATGEGIRKIKIFGCPLTPKFGNFAFQYATDSSHDDWEYTVPSDTDILLTHGPPIGHLDDGDKGCGQLIKELWRVQPRVAVFGHIHAGCGTNLLWYSKIESCYESVVSNKRRFYNLFKMAWKVLFLAVGVLVCGHGRRPPERSQLVNAAIYKEKGGLIIVYV